MIDPFIVTDKEYELLQSQFLDLIYFVSWQLVRKNVKNNHTEEIDDIMQNLQMSLIRAGRYYKRQTYIEDCLGMAEINLDVTNPTDESEWKQDKKNIEKLKGLWLNKTKHGAHKQKFGPPEEELLESIVTKWIPEEIRPDKAAPLRIDEKFIKYCKAIAWNEQKGLGRKITREREIRSSQVSLSEFDNISFIGEQM